MHQSLLLHLLSSFLEELVLLSCYFRLIQSTKIAVILVFRAAPAEFTSILLLLSRQSIDHILFLLRYILSKEFVCLLICSELWICHFCEVLIQVHLLEISGVRGSFSVSENQGAYIRRTYNHRIYHMVRTDSLFILCSADVVSFRREGSQKSHT